MNDPNHHHQIKVTDKKGVTVETFKGLGEALKYYKKHLKRVDKGTASEVEWRLGPKRKIYKRNHENLYRGGDD